MASNAPIVKQVSKTALLFQFVVMGLFIYIFYDGELYFSFCYGLITYSLLRIGLNFIFANDHRKGLKLVKQNKNLEAISYFEKSVEFFTKYGWLDKYRFITLLNPSKMTFKEMSLCSIAFCFTQTNNGVKAKELYERILAEYPENGIAISATNMINALKST